MNARTALVAVMMALGLQAMAQNGGDLDDYEQSTGDVCGMTGDAKTAAGRTLDRLKNRYDPVSQLDIEPSITMQALLKPGYDDTRFQPTYGASLRGYVVDVKVGGTETCNCHARRPIDRDTHIEIALSPDAAPTERIIVEVTPRMRYLMSRQQPSKDWTTATLQQTGPKGIKHKWVQVTGWMLFDSMHVHEAENTSPGNPSNWRATCWEIHPVTSISVIGPNLPSPSDATLVSSIAASVADARRTHASSVPEETRRSHRSRNAWLRARFRNVDLERDNDSR